MRELVQLKNEPPEGIRVSHPEDNMLDVTGIIEGPSKPMCLFSGLDIVLTRLDTSSWYTI